MDEFYKPGDARNNSKPEEEDGDDKLRNQHRVSVIFDELLAQTDYIPGGAILNCCRDGKTKTLEKMLSLFPKVDHLTGMAM